VSFGHAFETTQRLAYNAISLDIGISFFTGDP
jgi:hypothetical protein